MHCGADVFARLAAKHAQRLRRGLSGLNWEDVYSPAAPVRSSLGERIALLEEGLALLSSAPARQATARAIKVWQNLLDRIEDQPRREPGVMTLAGSQAG